MVIPISRWNEGGIVMLGRVGMAMVANVGRVGKEAIGGKVTIGKFIGSNGGRGMAGPASGCGIFGEWAAAFFEPCGDLLTPVENRLNPLARGAALLGL